MLDYYEVPVSQYWYWNECVLTVDAPSDPIIDNVLRNVSARSAFTLVRNDGPADITIYTGQSLRPYGGYFNIQWDGNGHAYGAVVRVEDSGYKRGAVLHEVLHVLGLDHASKGIMHPVLHRNTMTKWDRLALGGLTCGT